MAVEDAPQGISDGPLDLGSMRETSAEYTTAHRIALGAPTVLLAGGLQAAKLLETSPQYDKPANIMTYVILGVGAICMAAQEAWCHFHGNPNGS